MSASRFIKCFSIGDGAVGKTCMLISYTSNTFPTIKEAPQTPLYNPGAGKEIPDDDDDEVLRWENEACESERLKSKLS